MNLPCVRLPSAFREEGKGVDKRISIRGMNIQVFLVDKVIDGDAAVYQEFIIGESRTVTLSAIQ